jgi:hypothetical protein
MRRFISRAAMVAVLGMLAMPLSAANLVTKATDVPPLQLSAGKAFSKEPIVLEAGKYYRWKIESDGTSEMAIAAPEFFRFIWINEVVINDIEVRPLGLDPIEFDDGGAAVASPSCRSGPASSSTTCPRRRCLSRQDHREMRGGSYPLLRDYRPVFDRRRETASGNRPGGSPPVPAYQ